MNKIGIVVLNYINYSETIACVDSLLKQTGVLFQIVIVDNGSNNESAEVLRKKYNEAECVHIIPNSQNSGYAKGNNIGINWLRKQGLDFIVICNSDIILSSEKILLQMTKGISGDIGLIIPIVKNLDDTIEMRTQYKRKLFTLRAIKALRRIIKDKGKSKQITKSNTGNSSYMELSAGFQEQYNVVTGSIFALTPAFFKYYNGLYPETFLYVEEIATLLLVSKARLKCFISETDIVIHKGAASTDSSLKPGTEKKRLMMIDSAKSVMKLAFMPRFIIRMKYKNL